MARKHTYHKENCDCLIREIMAKKLGKSSTNTKERNEYQFYFQKKAQVSCDIL